MVVQEGGRLVSVWSEEIEKAKGWSGADVFVGRYGLVTSTKSVLFCVMVGGAVALVRGSAEMVCCVSSFSFSEAVSEDASVISGTTYTEEFIGPSCEREESV